MCLLNRDNISIYPTFEDDLEVRRMLLRTPQLLCFVKSYTPLETFKMAASLGLRVAGRLATASRSIIPRYIVNTLRERVAHESCPDVI